MPAELDVPHWAIEPVADFRARNACPPWLTDRMIFAAMTLIDNDEAKKAEVLRDMAIVIYLFQQRERENAPRS